MKISVETLEECCGLEPHMTWQKKRMAFNQSQGYPYDTEANGMRQTGRTTNMLLRAVARCSDNHNVTIHVKTQKYKNLMIEKLEKLLEKVPNLGWRRNNDFINIGSNSISFHVIGNVDVLFDDAINDTWNW